MGSAYREIVEPERLVFTSAALNEKGKPLFEVLNTVTFADQGGKTRLTLHVRVVKTGPRRPVSPRDGGAGWRQTLERLKECLGKVRG
jgi:uncharacterized protein YndB with AHSA1/START domain